MANRNGDIPTEEPSHLVKEYVPRSLIERQNWGEKATFDGKFIWKVASNEFSMMTSTTATWSPYFFTSRTGIKMCLKMYPIGLNTGQVPHMSLYFSILIGHYDEVQNWPFNQRVQLSILSQEGGANITKIITPDPTSATFQRQTSNIHIGTGFENFIELAQLLDQRNGFLKDNAIFIKAEVDTQDLKEPFTSVSGPI